MDVDTIDSEGLFLFGDEHGHLAGYSVFLGEISAGLYEHETSPTLYAVVKSRAELSLTSGVSEMRLNIDAKKSVRNGSGLWRQTNHSGQSSVQHP